MNLIIDTFKRKKILFNRINAVREWKNKGKKYPPPHELKQSVIEYYRNKYSLKTFVETGTYLGKMIEVQSLFFKKCYSIELSEALYDKAVIKFSNMDSVTLLQGDSGERLPEVVSGLSDSSLFWLDGHYSEGFTAKGTLNTPVIKELKTILSDTRFNHVILVDDARCFDGTNDYPTIVDLISLVKSLNPKYSCQVEDDIIRITVLE
jgi:hypothetical protein